MKDLQDHMDETPLPELIWKITRKKYIQVKDENDKINLVSVGAIDRVAEHETDESLTAIYLEKGNGSRIKTKSTVEEIIEMMGLENEQ